MSITADPYDRAAIFNDISPISPSFMQEAIRTLMRTLPLGDPTEPEAYQHRRMRSALFGLSALHPRDEIEVMLGVQAMAAYHNAAAGWRLGMNLKRPHGDSTRHITAAATAARTFDTMLRALERRQAKPLSVPAGRPEPCAWDEPHPTAYMGEMESRNLRDAAAPDAAPAEAINEDEIWTPEDIAFAHQQMEKERIEKENEGLDIANTEGILPGGGMILPEHPTPQQAAYMGRRLRLMYQREHQENLRNGRQKSIRFRGIRPGDLIP